MQFTCDSCKALLQISDEKLRGKRLVVKCKRCGSRIQIADPALRTPARVEPVMATPHSVSTVSGVPTAPDTDTESTRAIDSGLLARAIRASKGETPGAEAQPEGWFALIANKQEGPFSRAELALKTAQGTVGPRTYLWREGMADWVRAKDVPEAAPFFAEPPPRTTPGGSPRADAGAQPGSARETPPEASAAAAASPPPAQDFAPPRPTTPAKGNQPVLQDRFDRREAPTPEPAEQPAAAAGASDLQEWASSDLEHEPADEPLVARGAQEERAKPRSAPQVSAPASAARKPWPWMLAGVGIVVVAGLVAAWIMLTGREPARPPSTSTPSTQGPVQKTPPAAPKPPADESGAALPGLSASAVKDKLDQAKPALQACVDDALKKEPSLKVGRIHIATTIAPSGAVTSATIDKKNVDTSPLGACLKRVTQKIQFPAFSGEPFEVDIPILVSSE